MDTANHHLLVQTRRRRRQHRVRKRLFGTPERPRLAVFRSSKHIYAQVINDQSGTTLVSASTLDPEIKAQVKYGGNKAAAAWSARPSPSGPRRPVLTRFALTAEATSTMVASRPWPRPGAKAGSFGG